LSATAEDLPDADCPPAFWRDGRAALAATQHINNRTSEKADERSFTLLAFLDPQKQFFPEDLKSMKFLDTICQLYIGWLFAEVFCPLHEGSDSQLSSFNRFKHTLFDAHLRATR
jgi:hypothetical protein